MHSPGDRDKSRTKDIGGVDGGLSDLVQDVRLMDAVGTNNEC